MQQRSPRPHRERSLILQLLVVVAMGFLFQWPNRGLETPAFFSYLLAQVQHRQGGCWSDLGDHIMPHTWLEDTDFTTWALDVNDRGTELVSIQFSGGTELVSIDGIG